MSMTLKRRVNGQVVPIKLSLLDAFKGVPPPRKRRAAPRTRSSATQTSPERAPVPTEKDQETAQPVVTDDASETKPTGGSSDNTSVTKQGDDEARTFTAADDAKLIELKAAGKTWKEIVAEMKKSHSAVKQRFKEIGPKTTKDEGRDGGAEDEKTKEGPAARAAEKKGESDNKVTEKDESDAKVTEKETPGDQTQEAAKADKKSEQDAIKPKNATAKSNPIDATTSEATANHINLAEIAARYEHDKWRSAASRYFDLTGNRISSKTAQEWAEAAN